MDDDAARQRTAHPAPAGGGSEVEPLPPASLDPRSPGCWIPFGIFGVIVLAAVFGFQQIVSSTGPWAIASARNAVAESGLPEADRAAVLAEIARLEGALESGDLDARGVTMGVDGVLREPLIPLLALDDARARRIPASGLTAEEASAADAVLAETASLFDAGLIRRPQLIQVLGPLARTSVDDAADAGEAPGAAPRVPLDDAALRALVERAAAVNAGVDEAMRDESSLRPVDRELLLERLRAHVDAVLAAD